MARRSVPRKSRAEGWAAAPGTSRAERTRAGKAMREKVPRSLQAEWKPAKDRPDIVGILEASGRTRVPELLPIRYGRMALSPFAFLRGAAGVMAVDLKQVPVTGAHVQMGGDAHVANFGIFATPERLQVFDTNDFDETLPGPWEFDLKRLATSLTLVGRVRKFPKKLVETAVRAAVETYRDRMQEFAQLSYLDTWYFHLDLGSLERKFEKAGEGLFADEIEQSRQRTGFHAFPKMVKVERGGARVRIRDVPPLLVHYQDPHEEAAVRRVFERYRESLPPERRMLFDRYHLEDVARKVVGIGSVGTRCAVGLFLADKDVLDPLFLQVKEADPSAWEAALGPSPFQNHAERVVVGQRLVQQSSDVFLGFSQAEWHDFYVRQLRDMKFVSDLLVLGSKALRGQAELCGSALAHAHARTGDPAFIAGYLGQGDAFAEAIVRFAKLYADQSEVDHATLVRAIAKGRIPAAHVA